jgi:hypothetical protein
MIKENTEPKEEQTIITSPTSTIHHTVQQLTITNNKWKQISLQGLDITPQETKLKISTPTFHPAPQRVSFLLRKKKSKISSFFSSLFVEQQQFFIHIKCFPHPQQMI